MELRLDKGERVEVYTPWGGGVTVWLKSGAEGLEIAAYSDINVQLLTGTKGMQGWRLSRHEETGFDRT